MRKTVLLFLIMTMLVGCSTMTVIPISSEAFSSKPGLVYALPKHELDVVVDYEQVSIKGSKYLKDNKISKKEMEDALSWAGLRLPFLRQDAKKIISYKIKSIKVESRVVPDTTAFYFIETHQHNHPFLKKVFLFELTKQSYLSQANASSEDYTVDFVLNTAISAVKVAAGIANPAAGLVSATGTQARPSIENDTISTQIVQNDTLNELYQLLARYRELENYKWDLYNGGIDLGLLGSKPDIGFIIKKVEEEQSEIAKLFVGSKETITARKVYPTDPTVDSQVVFRFNNKTGFGTGDPYEMEITTERSQGLHEFLEVHADTVKRKKGLHYRIPATALVVVKKANNTFYRVQHTIPQLGEINFLPNRVGMTKNDIKYTLDPTTGALLKFDANGEGINLEAVKAFQEAATEVPRLFEKPAENEFEDLEKQIKQVELENLLLEQQIKKDSLSAIQGSGL